MIFKVFLPVFFAILSLISPNDVAAQSSLTWMTDYDSALEKSQKEKLPILLYFTASDWSGWCMKMKKEVLDAPEFIDAIANSFVCVEVDLPRKVKLSDELAAQNEQLREQLAITEFPRIVLLGCNERVFLKAGYLPGGPAAYAKYLLRTTKKDRAVSALIHRLDSESPSSIELEEHYLAARELRRDADALVILEAGLTCSEPKFFLFEQYKLLAEQKGLNHVETQSVKEKLSATDPSNETGVQFTLAMIAFQELSKTASSTEAVVPLERYVAQFGRDDSQNVWRLEMMIAQAYLDSEESTKALKHAKIAFEHAPTERKKEIEQSISYIQDQALR